MLPSLRTCARLLVCVCLQIPECTTIMLHSAMSWMCRCINFSCKHTFAFVHLIRKRVKTSGGKKTANGKMLVAIGRRGHVERHRRTLLPKRPLVTTLVDRRPFFDFNDILESSGKQVATPLIKFADVGEIFFLYVCKNLSKEDKIRS